MMGQRLGSDRESILQAPHLPSITVCLGAACKSEDTAMVMPQIGLDGLWSLSNLSLVGTVGKKDMQKKKKKKETWTGA